MALSLVYEYMRVYMNGNSVIAGIDERSQISKNIIQTRESNRTLSLFLQHQNLSEHCPPII